jgi:osmotically-inducible protein OsmY
MVGSGASTGASSSQSGTSRATSTSGTVGVAEDHALVGQIRQSLNQDSALTSVVPGLQISARNGIVTLAGNVSSEEQKRNIESIVQQIAGVTTVNNQLQVSLLSATSRQNETSSTYSGTANSGSEMQGAGGGLVPTSRSNEQSSIYAGSGNTNDLLLPTSRTNQQNQVYWNTNQTDTLSATSDRLNQPGANSRMFETNQAAGGNETVNTATANIQGTSEADKTLGGQIAQELRADSGLAAIIPQLRISVSEGKVTLRGTVQNEQQKEDIEAAIQRMSGVSSVDNQLQVGSDQPQAR